LHIAKVIGDENISKGDLRRRGSNKAQVHLENLFFLYETEGDTVVHIEENNLFIPTEVEEHLG
jgi:hypothetical protein